jgi:hypothetical protein
MDVGFTIFCVAFGLFLMGAAIESLNGYDEREDES